MQVLKTSGRPPAVSQCSITLTIILRGQRKLKKDLRCEFMKEAKVVSTAQMADGQSGVVVSVEGGHVMLRRLEALGIRPGKRIRKVSSAFMRGPSVIEVEGCAIAIGFGMANRIFAKTE
jgi:ferrous iron transport protein A